MAEHSCDLVSKVNLQELRNAIQQAQKEIATRFDFRGTTASLDWEEAATTVKVSADHPPQLRNVVDLLNGKLAKRSVPVSAFNWKPVEALPSGTVKQQAVLQQGLSSDQARAVVKTIKDLGLKIQPRIDGDAVRVAGKQIDDLQAAVRAIQAKDFGVPIQAENYR